MKRSEPSVAATEYVAALTELGDLLAKEPLTVSVLRFVAVPIPTNPLLSTRIASVAPLLPTWKMMSAPAAPTPVVVLNVSVLVVAVPPMCKGNRAEVVKTGVTNVGLVENTRLVLVVPVAPAAV